MGSRQWASNTATYPWVFNSAREFSLFRVQLKLHDGHGRNWACVVGIKNGEQRFRDFRKVIVNFQMHSGRKKSGSFDEPLDMRIFTAVCVQQEPGCDLGV